MRKEPLGLYIFRLLATLGILAFMAMLYWSSNLVEQDLAAIRSEIIHLGNNISALQEDVSTGESRKEFHDTAPSEETQTLSPPKSSASKIAAEKEKEKYPFMNSEFPNLLEEDPFYNTTLPKLLGKNFKFKGKFQSAGVGKPQNLHPFSNWAQVSAWLSQCSVSAARLKFGIYETQAPDMAIKIEARPREDGTNEFWVFLRDNVFWHPLQERLFENKVKLASHFTDKHQVTAHDYKFYFDALMNPFVEEPGAVALRNYLGDIQEIEVKDKLTFVVRWSAHPFVDEEGKTVPRIKYMARSLTGSLSPLASFVYQYFPDGTKIIEDDKDPQTYRTNSVWAQNFSRHWANNIIVSCGPWLFDGLTDRQIKFKKNPNFYATNDALAEGMVYEFKNAPETIWQDFKIDRLDSYALQPDQLIDWETFKNSETYQKQVKEGSKIERLDYPARAYAYIGWNEATPFFKERKVRQALTMAINRGRIIKQILNGMGMEISGPFSPGSSENDPSIKPWPYDIDAAKRLLEEEGWYDSDGDGIIDKVIDGKIVPFQFSITYFVKNPTTKSICEYVSTALKEIGISCSLNGVDIADLSAAVDGKTFEALTMAWLLGTPPSDPRQLWHSSGAKEPGSSNFIGFANAEADSIIDKLSFEDNREKRQALYHRFHAILHEEQPYTFLFIPKTAFLYRERVQNVFIPEQRQDLVPGADITEPISSAFWLKAGA